MLQSQDRRTHHQPLIYNQNQIEFYETQYYTLPSNEIHHNSKSQMNPTHIYYATYDPI